MLDKLTDENREFLCIEESSYKDSIGRELPLFILGQEALEFFLIGIDVNYRASVLRELYAYRDMVAQRRVGRADEKTSAQYNGRFHIADSYSALPLVVYSIEPDLHPLRQFVCPICVGVVPLVPSGMVS